MSPQPKKGLRNVQGRARLAGLKGDLGLVPARVAVPVSVGRQADREATRPLNAVDEKVLAVLADHPLYTSGIAWMTGVSTAQARHSLGALRARGLAVAERQGQTNVWTRA